MPRPEKVAIVDEIKDKLSRAQGVILADYRGLTVMQATELRRKLRRQGLNTIVLKNTLTAIAAREAGFEDLTSLLVGPTAIAFWLRGPGCPGLRS